MHDLEVRSVSQKDRIASLQVQLEQSQKLADMYREQIIQLEDEISRIREEGDIGKELFRVRNNQKKKMSFCCVKCMTRDYRKYCRRNRSNTRKNTYLGRLRGKNTYVGRLRVSQPLYNNVSHGSSSNFLGRDMVSGVPPSV